MVNFSNGANDRHQIVLWVEISIGCVIRGGILCVKFFCGKWCLTLYALFCELKEGFFRYLLAVSKNLRGNMGDFVRFIWWSWFSFKIFWTPNNQQINTLKHTLSWVESTDLSSISFFRLFRLIKLLLFLRMMCVEVYLLNFMCSGISLFALSVLIKSTADHHFYSCSE